MKKSLIALALVSMMGVGSAFAEGTSVSVNYQRQSVDDKSGPDQTQISLQVKQKVNSLFSVDFGVNAAQNDNSATASKAYKDTTRVEAGVSLQKAIYGPVDGYARLGLGQKAPSGTEAFFYHSEEVGVIGHLPYGFDAKLGYRWRQEMGSTSASQVDTNKTLRMGLAYNISKNDVIALNRDNVQQHGANGSDQTAYHVAYTRKF